MQYKKLEHENEYEYIYRLGSQKEAIGTWQDVADILNEELGNEYTESRYRKMYQAFSKMMDGVQARVGSDSAYLEDLKQQRRELEKERKKIQTEKLEYNKWLREEARDEMIWESIREEISKMTELPDVAPIYRYPDCRSAVICFGDEHFGADLDIIGLSGETINKYNPDIFYERMNALLGEIVAICEKECLAQLHVYALGDFADGMIRVSQLMKLRYGIVEAAIRYADFLCSWLNELSKVACVRFQMARGGNHTQLRMLGQPKNTFKEENMDKVVAEMIRIRLADNPNFTFVENPTGYIFDNVCGFNILGLHGEVKSLGNAIKEFSHTYKTPIDILIAGHKHHGMSETVGICRDVVGVPSIMGVDDYAMSLNATSNPGATVLIIECGKGKTIEYAIKL